MKTQFQENHPPRNGFFVAFYVKLTSVKVDFFENFVVHPSEDLVHFTTLNGFSPKIFNLILGVLMTIFQQYKTFMLNKIVANIHQIQNLGGKPL